MSTQNKAPLWQADLGDGSYRNPILYVDYSDPDVIRVGEDYFMVASSFCNVPALPLLHSRDLVNWRVVNYVLDRLPFPTYDTPAHGRGVWAPAIRYHEGVYYVIFPMPDEGIFTCTATDPFGTWSEPVALREGKGWIDPCPFWDDDGKAYMVSAFAKSRCGIKSKLNLAPMKPDCSALIDDGRHIFDGRLTQPTIEGPKLYKRNGFYYILAPAGGVKHGWQTALRSRNIWGPYEERIVMFRGSTDVNGPHQGALVDTPSGESWFLHFQDVGTCGRIVHLQPVQWVDDWPVIGDDPGQEGCGSPVKVWKKPDVGPVPPLPPADDCDDFSGPVLGLDWQWNANPQPQWATLQGGLLELHAQPYSGPLCDLPSFLLRKFMAPGFAATARIDIRDMQVGDLAGLGVLGQEYGALGLRKTVQGIDFVSLRGQLTGSEEQTTFAHADIDGWLYLRLNVTEQMACTFSYSIDGNSFIPCPGVFTATAGRWVGAKFGFFALGDRPCGTLKIDWLRVEKPESPTL